MFETCDIDELKKKIAKGRIVALFYASWCHDSKGYLPTFDACVPGATCEVIKVRIDEDANPIWDEFKIEFVPTIVLFENGKEKRRAEHGRGHYLGKEELLALLK